MFDRTVPSAASTDAAVSSHDVSIPRTGPDIQVEAGCSMAVIMKAFPITLRELDRPKNVIQRDAK